MAINPETLQQIRVELDALPHGSKGDVAKRRAGQYGVTEATLYRQLNLRKRSRTGDDCKRPELREWARIVAIVKKRPPKEAGEITTEQAIKIAVRAKAAPDELLAVHSSTIDRVMRELGTNKKSIRAVRFQAKLPNQAHQFDASTSASLHIARTMPDGNHVLRLHRPAAGGYKNKPIPADRLRPVYYAVCDDHSGVRLSVMIPSMGENARDSALALDKFWRVLGVPKRVLADGGALKKCLATNGYIHACGVELPPATPYASRTRGKIERTFRTMWQRFEKQLYAVDDWQKFEISRIELNARLDRYMEEENQRHHRFERKITRWDAWRRVMLQGGITVLPEDALSRAAEMVKRKIGIDGLIWIDSIPYEVVGLHDAWAFIYRSMFEDIMVAEDVKTGERYKIKDFSPLDENEFKAFKDTPHQLAIKASSEIHIPASALLFGEDHVAAAAGNVVSLPIRKTERDVPNVFDVERYASIDEAMEDFDGIVGPVFIPADQRKEVADAIEANGRTRAFVHELGQEIRGGIELRRAEGM